MCVCLNENDKFMNVLNCATGTLAAYVPSGAQPWNRARVQHLFRRTGFGIAAKDIGAALTQNPSNLVDALVDEAINLPLPEAPFWADYTISDYQDNAEYVQQLIDWSRQWIGDMHKNGFREKLALFWSNHFVTEIDAYQCPSWMYRYHKILQTHALGNFKDFVIEMGRTPAMLVYLNGVQNTRFEPNENYARELFELFTLGRDNGYTQEDIEEAARALTGWNNFTELCAPIGYRPGFHDPGSKTIFGQSGNWNYEQLHDILFEQRGDQIATHICTKLYKHFVSVEVDMSIVAGMAATFKANDFELAPVIRQLLKSEHFFDEKNIGVQIKSPVDYLLMVIREWGFEEIDENIQNFILYTAANLGQRIFNPVDVAGWPGDRMWIDNSRMPGRWQFGQAIAGSIYENAPSLFSQLGLRIAGDTNDPYFASRRIVDYLIPNGLQDEDVYERAATVFKSPVPENYFEDGSWDMYWESVPAQVGLLLLFLLELPDFQLS